MALLKRVIACLDVHAGRVVKGTQFVDLKDMGDPVERALYYQQQGADEIVLLDISASQEDRRAALVIISKVAQQLSIPFTVGGGVNSVDDVSALLDAGADKVSINSGALKAPDLIDRSAGYFGSQCIVVAIDFRLQSGDVYARGGGQNSQRNIAGWAREACARGAGELLLTCIDRDGSGDGFDCQVTTALARELRIPVIASGGARSARDFVDVFTGGADAALAAGIFHRGEVHINEVKAAMHTAGIPVRLTS